MANIIISDIHSSNIEENYLSTNLSEQEMKAIFGGGLVGAIVGAVAGFVAGGALGGPAGAIIGAGVGFREGDALQQQLFGS